MIYAIRSGEFVKLGYSVDPQERISSISTMAPVECILLGVQEGTVRTERKLHQQFSNLRVNGEWFKAEQSLLDWIAENMRELPAEKQASKADRFIQPLRDLITESLNSGWSINGLAKSAGVSRPSLQDWITGKQPSISLEVVAGLCQWFGLSLTQAKPRIPKPQ